MQVALVVTYHLAALVLLGRALGGSGVLAEQSSKAPGPPVLWPALERAYLWGLVPLEVYCAFGHILLCHAAVGGERLPFLPLLLTSVYGACGVVWAWAKMASRFLRWRSSDAVLEAGRGKTA